MKSNFEEGILIAEPFVKKTNEMGMDELKETLNMLEELVDSAGYKFLIKVAKAELWECNMAMLKAVGEADIMKYYQGAIGGINAFLSEFENQINYIKVEISSKAKLEVE